jgi:DNA-binding transcriptional ArsR family regulator
LAGALDAMWEIVLSLHLLQNSDFSLVFGPWRRTVIGRARRSALGKIVSFLTAINPAAPYLPDFLTPTTALGDIASGIDAIRSTPTHEFKSQLTRLASTHTVPTLARPLADGDPDAAKHLCQTLSQYHQVAVAPYLPIIGRRIAQVRDDCSRRLCTGGTEALLGSLSGFRWQYPILEANFPTDFDLHLEGRGLLLIPAFFCTQYPVKFFDPGLPPTLVFPVSHDPAWLLRDATSDRSGSLVQLIGATRASILELIGSSRVISAAAIVQKLHLSAPAVSYHTKILRESGLLGSDRDGPSVIHYVTPLGTALLHNAPPPA